MSWSYSQWYNGATESVAREMHAAMMRGDGPLWLYFKPNGLAFAFAGDGPKPDGFELVTGERVPSDRTVNQLLWWVRTHTARVPVLPGD